MSVVTADRSFFMYKSIQDRIEKNIERVPFSGCWLWMGTLTSKGYGELVIKKRTRRAHKVVYETFVGQVKDGLYLCHRCDVRSCVNPDHLFQATQAENINDCLVKGRFPTKANGLYRSPTRSPTCKKGHPYPDVTGGRRRCTTCRNAYMRQRRKQHPGGRYVR